MLPKISPDFHDLHAELSQIPWLACVGETESVSLPFAYRFARDADEAATLAAGEEWEGRTLDRRNDLTEFLSLHAPARDEGWSAIAGKVRGIIDNEVLPRLGQRLEALPQAHTLLGWDVANALMEAAFLDCRPPVFFTRLMDVYRAGHIPVGWDESQHALVIY